MKDRITQYPHRYQLVPVSGQSDTYDIIAKPGTVTEVGTPLNKATLFSDETAALYGLTGGDAVVDMALKLASSATYRGKYSMLTGSAEITGAVGYLSFSGEERDDLSVINLASSYTKLTIPASLDGKLARFFINVECGANTTQKEVKIILRKNGVDVEILASFYCDQSIRMRCVSYSSPIVVASGDYFEFYFTAENFAQYCTAYSGGIAGMEVLK